MNNQPYKLPDNWRWAKLGDVCRVENGYAFKSDNFSEEIGTPIIRISNIFDDKVDLSNCVKTTETHIDKKFIIKNGDLLIAMSGATTGKNGIFNSSEIAYLNQRVGNIKIIDDKILLQKYRNFYIKEKTEEILRNAYGGAQPNISSSKICEMLMPLPPLDGQQRIVDIIESLFAKLDNAKVLAQSIIVNYDLRRSAILHKAFTGKLTDTNLNITDFSEVANIKCNLVSPKDYKNYPHIAPDNIEKKTGKLISYRTIAEDKVISNKHRFYPRQILYSKIRPYLSKVIIAEFDGLCSADMYPIESKENTKYLWYYMLSDEFLNQASNAGSRTLLPKINQKELLSIKVPICSLENQKEIVRILDSLLDKEQRTKDLAEQILQKIDLMKKAILTRAFHGEL